MDPTRCKYANKICGNERSRKPDGSYHRFCDDHRIRANEAQRRWYARSRQGIIRHPTSNSTDKRTNTIVTRDQKVTRVCEDEQIDFAINPDVRLVTPVNSDVSTNNIGSEVASSTAVTAPSRNEDSRHEDENWSLLVEFMMELGEMFADDKVSPPIAITRT